MQWNSEVDIFFAVGVGVKVEGVKCQTRFASIRSLKLSCLLSENRKGHKRDGGVSFRLLVRHVLMGGRKLILLVSSPSGTLSVGALHITITVTMKFTASVIAAVVAVVAPSASGTSLC